MGSRVYDPIHDVFQERNGEEEVATKSHVPSMNGTSGKKKVKESSKYNRHLKKPDGDYFTRKDLQLHFLTLLLSDKRLLFRNIYKECFNSSVVPIKSSKSEDGEEVRVVNVVDNDYNARTFINNERLTFSQAYVLAIASSTKGSKILRDKLLFDQHIAYAVCVLSLLINIGRLNTTVNFFYEMTSQLRTFHSVPVLQHKSQDPRALQDTPRLKSILKSLPVGNKSFELSKMYEPDYKRNQELNVVNLIFTICDSVSLINMNLLSKYINVTEKFVSLFNMLDSSEYEPEDRCNVFLWLLYVHLETDLSELQLEEAVKKFSNGNEKLELRKCSQDYDIDTEEEITFGEDQKLKRKEFLIKIRGEKEEEEKISEKEPSEEVPVEEETKIKVQVQIPLSTTQQNHEMEEEVFEEEMIESGDDYDENGTKRKKSSNNNDVNTNNDDETQIDKLIEYDKNKKLIDNMTQIEIYQKLRVGQKFARKKRQEIGLMTAFDEFEDISLGNVLGVRGRKRKKFQDKLLGFETDYLMYFELSKRTLLENSNKNTKKSGFFKITK